MRYLNFLLILVIFGCYSGVHTSNFNLTKEATPSCHTNSSVQKIHHDFLKVKFQINNNQERQSCCVEAVNYKVDFESINPIITATIFKYYSLYINIKNNDNFRDNNLNNHSPPKIFISKSSFLI